MLKLFSFLLIFQLCESELMCKRALSNVMCFADSENNALQRGVVSDDADAQFISLANCNLVSIQEESFEGLPSLKTLDISSNRLTVIKSGILDNLNSVQTLNLSHNSITQLPLGIFDHMSSLTIMDLSNNQISKLTVGIFDSTVYLSTLYLGHNSLQDLPLGIFNKARGLLKLDLSFSNMSSLPAGIFDSLQQLSIVDLSFSNFVNMPLGMFDKNEALTELRLSGNGLNDIPHNYFDKLSKLVHLDLSRNLISSLREDVFAVQTSLQNLNLSSNLLTDVSPASHLQSLLTFDISKNKLSVVPVFNLPVLKYLDISGNRFTNYGMNVGTNIPKKLRVFKLYRNPWQCACLDQVIGLLQGRKVNYEYSAYFDGKKPVCLIVKNKVSLCVRNNSQDQQLYEMYTNSLKKYTEA